MRLLSTVARKLLLAFGYPRFDIPMKGIASDTDNNYQVGATKIRMSHEIPACQFFYPAAAAIDDVDNNNKHDNNNIKRTPTFIPYFRKEAVTGMIEYLGFGDGILQLLEETSHPCQRYYNCPPYNYIKANDEKNTKKKKSNKKHTFPLILFSHGLGGNMELYTELCTMLASCGYIVIALEHEDGSASYAAQATKETATLTLSSSSSSSSSSSLSSSDGGDEQKKKEEKGTQIPYKLSVPNSKVPYSRHKVVDMRTPMLEQRVHELQQVYNYITTIASSSSDNNACSDAAVVDSSNHSELLPQIISSIDLKELHLVGHSFGGAAQLLAAQQWMTATAVAGTTLTTMDTMATMDTTTATTTTTTLVIPPIPKSIMVLDAWCFALPDEVLNCGIKAKSTTTTNKSHKNNKNVNFIPSIISILSEEWAFTNREREQTLQFLRHCNNDKGVNENDSTRTTIIDTDTTKHSNNNNNVHSYYARHSVHQSFSDTGCFLPTYLARKIGNRGIQEQRHLTNRACVQEFVRNRQQQQSQAHSQQLQLQLQVQQDDNSTIDDKNKTDTDILIPFPYQ